MADRPPLAVRTIDAIAVAYRSGLRALAACIPFAAAFGVYIGVVDRNPFLGVGMALAYGMFAMAAGLVIVCVYGAPAYALLRRYRAASYQSALVVGLLPGALYAALDMPRFALLLSLHGMCTAALTHHLAERNRAARI